MNAIYLETNTQPDLVFCFRIKNVEQNFAVDCKYRSDYTEGGIYWARESQIDNYKRYQDTGGLPVFVVIGVGGTPSYPEEVFVVPINTMEDTFITRDSMERFIKHNFNHNNVYFNHEELTLS